LVADGCGIDRRYFDIEDRPKSPASTEAKIKRKGQDVGQLGDRLAFRIILKTELENQKGNLDAFCHKVYKALATGSGRLNPGLAPFYKDLKDRDSREDPVEKHAREHTKPGQDAAAVRAEVEVALRDPMTVDYEIEELRGEIRRHGILKKPMQADARYDDYITIAKENGYRAIHDTLCLVIDGREIEIEIQILTEAMHEFNTYGPRAGHSYYKSGMQGHSEEIGDLRACAGEILQGRAPAPNHVHVYANTGEVVHHKGGMTVLDFAVLTDIEPAQIGGARIGNPDPFADRNLQRVYGLSEPLQTADCIAELLDRQGRSLHYKLDSMTPKLPRPALWEYLRSLWPA
ncbi:MAG TPA: hypothetical protein VMV79_06695, partial [Alphaproteobacteria bacterium]|nr:hypothetical protein [Alphaproteobacteria bacterium]